MKVGTKDPTHTKRRHTAERLRDDKFSSSGETRKPRKDAHNRDSLERRASAVQRPWRPPHAEAWAALCLVPSLKIPGPDGSMREFHQTLEKKTNYWWNTLFQKIKDETFPKSFNKVGPPWHQDPQRHNRKRIRVTSLQSQNNLKKMQQVLKNVTSQIQH